VIPALVSVAWAGLVLALAARARRRHSFLGTLALAQRQSESPKRPGTGGLGEASGLVVLRAGRARLVGAVTVATAVALVVRPALAPLPALLAVVLPGLVSRRQERRRLLQLEADLPEVVDLLLLAVASGCNVSLAVAAAGRRGVGPLAGELRRVCREVAWGRRLADALDDLPTQAGETIRPLSTALTACERYGTPLGPSLQRLSDDVRRQRQRLAEEAARKVPVALLFPLVLCILPAFALLTVAPLVVGAVGRLGL
jgi:tight adherence protein C